MNVATEKAAAREFVSFWTGKGYEKGQTQPFWIGLLRVLGVANPDQGFIEFEDKANIDAAHGFIDGYIPATHVMIEQKSLGKNLRAAIRQSDGSLLSPYQQAKRYIVDLPLSRHPRWVVTCNFAEFLVYDMEKPNAEPESLLLENLPEELYRLKFLTDTGSETIRREEEVSKRAGEVVGLIYDALIKQYENSRVERVDRVESHDDTGSSPCSTRSTRLNDFQLASLNELCVRIVFLLYAEDAEVFGRLQFHDYLKQFPAPRARRALIDLFKVLDTPPEKRDPYLEADLAAFPYVNGGLFRGEIEIPPFNDEILDLVLRKGSEEFDWSGISPVIFGAVFESTLNPETRRKGGMHYTSVANIHKVIDPLFLDRLKATLADAKAIADKKARNAALRAFIDHLASLTFLDPACGSGNFLTETYICLRRLENEALALLLGGQSVLDLEGDTIKVSIAQFHGIEINDFAVRVAQTALWIAEHQMLRETATLLHRNLDFLPLRDYDGIVEGNALRMDWQSILNAECKMQNAECGGGSNSAFCIQHSAFSFIIGNPPFRGARWMDKEQKADLMRLFPGNKRAGELDFVCGWYAIASRMVAGSGTRCGFVSTNSITQGEQVAALWGDLLARGVEISFAHQTFKWESESAKRAAVYCVIIGLSAAGSPGEKAIFDSIGRYPAEHINPYLVDAPDILVDSMAKPLSVDLPIQKGCQPTDGGNLIIEDCDLAEFLRREPAAAPFVKRLIGAREFINRKPRHCLWLVGVSPAQLRAMPLVYERVEKVRQMRLASSDVGTRRLADRPMLFRETTNPDTCVVIPEVSSQNRRYVPMGFIGKDVICTNKLQIIPNATLYHFGVLTSNVHMAWMRAVCGRLKTDYDYSQKIVYNNFPWPFECKMENGEWKIGGEDSASSAPLRLCVEKITATAQAILDARAKYPDSSLADLYDETSMPPDLRRAHQENDRAVMAAYGFSTKMTESECVAALFERYQALIARKGDEKEQ